jgi:hemoglobin/transferrin/lactoferrin receptor protein
MKRWVGLVGVWALAASCAWAQEADPQPEPAEPETAEPEQTAEPETAEPEQTAEPETAEPETALPDDEPLDVLTVAAARAERVVLDVPDSVSVLDARDVRMRRPPLNFADLLNRVPGVSGQATGPGQGSPFVRGLTGYHVLTLIDGVRLNGSFFRGGPNQYNGLVDPLLIERVEVLRGPSSTLYGSDALGGVLAVVTREPVRRKDQEGAEVWGRAGSYVRATFPTRQGAEPFLQPRLEVMGGAGPVSAIAGFDYVHAGDREGGQHQRTLRNTAYSQTNGDFKAIYRLSDKDRLVFAAQRTELRNGPRTHSTISSESYRGTSVGGDQRRDLDQSRTLLYLQAETRDRGALSRAKVNVSMQRHYEQQNRIRGNGNRTRTGFEVYSLGALVEAESDVPTPDALDLTVIYGLDYYHDFVDSFETDQGFQRPRGAIADDAHYDRVGAFLRFEVDLDVVLFTAGMRYELARVVARDVDPDPTDGFVFGRLVETYDEAVGNVGVVLPVIRDRLHLVASASQGFRAPNLDDTTSFRAVASSRFDSPSPNLDPERSLTLEIGAKWQWPALRGQLFYAYTFLEDVIARVPTGNVVDQRDEFRKQNLSRGAVQAIDGEAELRFDPLAEALGLELPPLGVSVLTRFSWVRGSLDALVSGGRRRDHLRRTPPARFAAALRWTEPETGWLWAEVEVELYRQQRRLSSGDLSDTQRVPPAGSEAFALWHLRAGVQLLDERVKVSVGLENLADKDYRLHGSGTNGYGRRLTFALEALW